jgi:hypothetical protein
LKAFRAEALMEEVKAYLSLTLLHGSIILMDHKLRAPPAHIAHLAQIGEELSAVFPLDIPYSLQLFSDRGSKMISNHGLVYPSEDKDMKTGNT